MATTQQIITELYKTHFVENYARKFCGEADMVNYEDIVQELYLLICETPKETIQAAYRKGGINAVRRYASGLITRQLRSTRSNTIYAKYTRHVYTEIPAGEALIRDYKQAIKVWQEERDLTLRYCETSDS